MILSHLRSVLILLSIAIAVLIPSSAPHLDAVAHSKSGPKPLLNRRSRALGLNLILLNQRVIDTSLEQNLDSAREDLQLLNRGNIGIQSASSHSRIVQFNGPISKTSYVELASTGCDIISYLPNNAYIISGNADQIGRVAGLRLKNLESSIQWMGRFEPSYKIAPTLDHNESSSADIEVDVEIELHDVPAAQYAVEQISLLAADQPGVRRFLKYIVVAARLKQSDIRSIAELEEVLFIDRKFDPTILDERSLQIAAGNLSIEGTQPAGPGYLSWLASKGLATESDYLVDITDTGLDRGSTNKDLIHLEFRDQNGTSRVAYNTNYYPIDALGDDRSGHGSMVASIAVGSGMSVEKDSDGYQYGLGVDPFVRLGASRIFGEGRKLALGLSFSNVVAAAYSKGARFSNNSWGETGSRYNVASQEYDALVRDAHAGLPGNNEMTIVFSAGNDGPDLLTSPGTAKNVITVAASENYRPEGVDSCNLDGEGPIGPDGADNVLDILRFSSGGPTEDGRFKPDITAPGTHIFGAASRANSFTAAGLCPGTPIYQPPGQRLFTWSSGTSLAAPHVTGAAALLRRFFVANQLLPNSVAPSPAMIKAVLLNSAGYLNGENAGGDLPGERQGWGLLNIGRAIDTTNLALVDQTTVFTESGQSFERAGSAADRTKPVLITLAWTDAPGSLAGPALVNDLDLEVSVEGQIVYRGNNFEGRNSTGNGDPDRLNNVERISIPASVLPAGNFTITIRAANIAGDGVPGNEAALDQDFALVISNLAAPIVGPPRPLITTATYEKKTLRVAGRNFSSTARVEINGQPVRFSLEFDGSTTALTVKKKAKKLALVNPGENEIVVVEDGLRSDPFILVL